MNLTGKSLLSLVLTALCAACALASAQAPPAAPAKPSAAAASATNFTPPPKLTLPLILRKLHTTARILHITAHPDDEDGGMLALESWGKGATVMLLTLTRGEGGQNKVGSNFSDELGILRTLELLESDKYYGVEQRFSRVADFGFSKTADETFQKWHGHDVALADVVRVIREFQPDVIISRFDGSPRDGHGNHQAAGILAREAFRAAADPNRFPEQLKEGLPPWQAKKLYIGNLAPGETPTVKLETTVVDPELGNSYAQLALAGLRHQLSQGAAGWQLPPGPRYSSYKLADTVLPNYKPEHEQDFMDGIDTSDLARQSRSDTKRSKAALERLMKGLQLDAKQSGSKSVLVPGGHTAISATVTNSGREMITLRSIELTIQGQPLPGDQKLARLKPGQAETIHASITVPANSVYTKPNFRRENRETDAIYTIDKPAYATLPLTPWPVTASAIYALDGGDGVLTATAVGSKDVPLAIAPAFSISVQPESQIVPASTNTAIELGISALSNLSAAASATITLDLAPGWRVQPPSQTVHFDGAAQQREVKFQIYPKAQSEGRAQIRAVLTHNGKQYSEGYTLVTREDLDSAYYYQPAVQRISVVDVKLPRALKIGYLPGSGDDILTVLRQIGLDVGEISPQELATGDLSRYGTIILGIRAYDTRDDVKQRNQRLLDYVSAGGTLVAQYNTDLANFNNGHFSPFPLEIGRERVSVEEQPVEVLKPDDPIFNFPNRITAKDFDGWVQERGLYFAGKWDSHFEPLLSSHDPNEPPLPGGLLRARFGKGTYIYNAYAFFRQLPYGVPGAIRLYVNLLSAGHQ